jgi:PAS domain-containing protein
MKPPLQPALDFAAFQRVCESRAESRDLGSNYTEAQRTLLTLLGNLPGMAYCRRDDEDWTMLFASEGCLELTGYAPADLTGNQKVSYASLIHPDDRERAQIEVQTALSARTSFRLVYRLRTAAPGCQK